VRNTTGVSDGAVLIFVHTPNGTPLVKDPSKPEPIQWKLPGGKVEWGETHAMAGQRELREETGLSVHIDDLEMLDAISKSNHVLTVFCVKASSLNGLAKRGIEGERVGVFTLEQIRELDDLLPSHRKILESLKII